MSATIPGDFDLSDVISTLALHDHLCVADENKTATLLDAMRAEGVDHGPKRAWAVVVTKRPTQNWRETCSHRL